MATAQHLHGCRRHARVAQEDVTEKAKEHITPRHFRRNDFRLRLALPAAPPSHSPAAMAAKEIATVVASNIVLRPDRGRIREWRCSRIPTKRTTHTAASRSHPGVSVVPAAFAAGEQFVITGAQFIRAVTLGYDVGSRITMSMGGPRLPGGNSSQHAWNRSGVRSGRRRRLCRPV